MASSQEMTGAIKWEEYFMGMAIIVAKRSKNPNEQIGCCIINDRKQIVGIGYNGLPTGVAYKILPDMKNVAEVRKYECPAAINAIQFGNSIDLRGCTAYVTDFPCNKSAQVIIQSGIKDVVFLSDNRSREDDIKGAKRMFEEVGVKYSKFELTGYSEEFPWRTSSEISKNPKNFELDLTPHPSTKEETQKLPVKDDTVRVSDHGVRKNYIEWDELFMAIAVLASKRSKDPVTQVGCCIVGETDGRKNRLAGVGYNGMPAGFFDRRSVWTKPKNDPMNSKHMYVCHAEMNAVLHRTSANLHGCTAHVTLFPCSNCAKVIIQSGIKKVVYLSDEKKFKEGNKEEDADHLISRRLLEAAGVTLKPFHFYQKDSELHQRTGKLSLSYKHD